MFGAKLKRSQKTESEALIVIVLEIGDCPLLQEDGAELKELDARQSNVLDHLQIYLEDLIVY